MSNKRAAGKVPANRPQAARRPGPAAAARAGAAAGKGAGKAAGKASGEAAREASPGRAAGAAAAGPARPGVGARLRAIRWAPAGELDHIADVGPVGRLLGAAASRAGRLPGGRVPALGALLAAAMAALVTGLAAGGGGGGRAVAALGLAVTALLTGLAWARPAGGRFGWLLPGLLRGIEYGLVVRLVAVVDPAAMPVAFAYLAAITYHHYDTVYRWRHSGQGPAAWVYAAGLGTEGRLLALAAVLAVTGDLRGPLAVLAAVLAAVFVTESALAWRAWLRSGGRPPTD